MRAIDAITLDFYGTLVHPCNGRGRGSNLLDYLRAQGIEPAEWDHRILYDLFDRHDTDYSPDMPEEQRRAYVRHLVMRAFECLGLADAEGLAGIHAQTVWQILGPDAFCLFPETQAVLAALRAAGYPIALLSNWQRGLGHFCTELGLADAFDHVLASAELGVAKPDAAIFTEACDRLGAAPARVLHVGDTRLDDYEGGREAGLQTILLHRGPEPPPDGVDAISDLRQLLSRLSAA